MNQKQLTNYWLGLPWAEIKLKVFKHMPKFVVILLILLISQSLAKLTWNIFTPENEINLAAVKYENAPAKLVELPSSLNTVSQYHLFGDARKQVVTQQKVIEAPETRLRLELKGVFASSNSAEALAIISSSKDKDKMYRIGDKVIGGALLHAVYVDRVILKRNGQLETLRLPKPKVDSKAFYNNNSHPQNMNGLSVNSSEPIKTTAKINSVNRLQEMRETLKNDPAKIWQRVRINPVMKNGQVEGYTLEHDDQTLMTSMNLRKTDVITGINGQSLSDPSTLYGLMSTLSEEDSVELTIVRNGQEQSIQLRF